MIKTSKISKPLEHTLPQSQLQLLAANYDPIKKKVQTWTKALSTPVLGQTMANNQSYNHSILFRKVSCESCGTEDHTYVTVFGTAYELLCLNKQLHVDVMKVNSSKAYIRYASVFQKFLSVLIYMYFSSQYSARNFS